MSIFGVDVGIDVMGVDRQAWAAYLERRRPPAKPQGIRVEQIVKGGEPLRHQ